VVEEDVSRYQVTLRRPGIKEAAEWTNEVAGPPDFFPLQTVDVLAAGKSIWVFDKANKSYGRANSTIRSAAVSEPNPPVKSRPWAKVRSSSTATRFTCSIPEC